MNPPPSDPGIPVLTEIIAPAAPAEPDRSVLDIEPGGIDALEPHAIASWNHEEWMRMERSISERVLHEVLARLDALLEQRVKENIALVMQNAAARLSSEIRSGLQPGLEQSITRAVQQEIARLHSSKK